MTTMIPFLLPTIEEELQELALAGVTVLVPASGAMDAIEVRPASDPAETDAAASWLLRRMGEIAAERERFVAAWNREQELLRARYERLIGPLDDRYAKLEALVCELASQADFGKKAKSRKVGFGEYGRRLVPEKLEITDVEQAIAFATKHVPDAVRAALKLPLAEAQLLFADRDDVSLKPELMKKEFSAYVKSTGDVPEGCALIAAHDEAWCKVVVPAGEGGE